jgi:hypothetical protein
MHVRFQTIKIHNLQIMAFDGFLPLREKTSDGLT